MPNVGDGGGEKSLSLGGAAGWVEWTGAIASKNHGLGDKILHRETKRIKFNGAKIVDGELANRYKIFNNVWDN